VLLVTKSRVSAQSSRKVNPLPLPVGLAIGLTAKRSFKDCQLGLNISLGSPTLDDVFAIAAEKVIDRLDSNAD